MTNTVCMLSALSCAPAAIGNKTGHCQLPTPVCIPFIPAAAMTRFTFKRRVIASGDGRARTWTNTVETQQGNDPADRPAAMIRRIVPKFCAEVILGRIQTILHTTPPLSFCTISGSMVFSHGNRGFLSWISMPGIHFNEGRSGRILLQPFTKKARSISACLFPIPRLYDGRSGHGRGSG